MMIFRFYPYLAGLIIIALTPLNFNGLFLGRTNKTAQIGQQMKSCVQKYLYFFPVSKLNSSLPVHYPKQNFLKFCHCSVPAKSTPNEMGNLARIDYCSNKHLDLFQHEKQYELNSKLLIEPLMLSLIKDHLRFVGPFISKRSLDNTEQCMLRTIMSQCSAHSNLNITRKCALTYLEDNWLYQKTYRDCESFEFQTKNHFQENKI